MQLKKTVMIALLASGPSVWAQAPVEDINDPNRRNNAGAGLEAGIYQQLQQLDAVNFYEKAVRQVGQIGRRHGVDMVTAIAGRQSGLCVILQLLITRFGHRHK